MNKVKSRFFLRSLWVEVCLFSGLFNVVVGQTSGYSLRFYGQNVNDIDRVKILIDNPEVPADVGSADFTIEFWMKARAEDNTQGPITPGPNFNWIFGNIVIDRDIFGPEPDYGISLGDGRVAFGVSGDQMTFLKGHNTIVGTTNVLDDTWHHIALLRRMTDGYLWIYVDGQLDMEGDGPDGDASYPDNRATNYPNSDPYIVIAAEKHDVAIRGYNGFLDEIRFSDTLRYTSNFTPPSAPHVPDNRTLALYHFDEGQGDIINDSSGAVGGPSNGVRNYGGSPPGPDWSTDIPFSPPVPVELSSFSAEVLENSIILTWRTVSETNNFGFDVEKSLDGLVFAKIGFVPGKGTTTISQEYQFRDRDMQPGAIYYRLRQIDTNGMFEFSYKIKIEISVPEDFALAQNYPNPFNPETFIEFRLARPGRAILKIFDLTGREVRTIVDEPHPAGLYRIKWSGLNNQDKLVPSGVYIYQLKAGEFQESRKMLLLR